ncbi:Serine-aspartate repeat-containing protein D precursor [Microbacterium sp. SA39]|nr:Serine-aspartate repeat-containing protein D precursor [Microbacterium sp. SA39]
MVAVLIGTIPAAAATTSSWATWQPLAGSAGAYTTTVQVAAQPELTATMTSDSRGGGVAVISGASTWLSEGTPIGAKYGSSRNQPYLNLRPKADNATGPSTTTYSFASPTPTSGWAFALGDIDADAVRIQAIGPDGQALDAAALGFQGGFNYCAPGVAGKPSCTGVATDVPAWDPAALTLTGNAAAADTSGSAAWFEPAAPISSLTFFFTRRSGFPVYQTWDAVADFTVRDIIPVAVSGQVLDDDGAPVAGVTVTIDGQTTTTDADGRYLFDQVSVGTHTATITPPDGYTLVTSPPPFTVPVGSEDPIDNVDFQVAESPSLSGTVRANGAGVSGVTVTATGPGASVITAVTDGSGGYVFPRLPAGDYDVTITTPGGYVATTPVTRNEQVAAADVENVDFELARLGAFDGTVRTDGGAPAAGVVIDVVGPAGSVQLTTDADGVFGLGSLLPGTYTLTVVPPTGSTVVGAATRMVVITAAGEAVVEQDFTLAAVVVPPPPSPDPSPDPSPGGGSGGGAGAGGGSLPGTGLGPETLAWAAGGALVLLLGATLTIVARRRSTRE